MIDLYGSTLRLTYDIIGEIAIDHVFDSLNKPRGPGGELFEDYERMQQVVPGSGGMRQDLGVLIPALDKIWVSQVTLSRCNQDIDHSEIAYGEIEEGRRCYGATADPR